VSVTEWLAEETPSSVVRAGGLRDA
jgi:hypothetical protein